MIKFGRLQRILSIAAVLTVATMALPQVVSGATPKPVISMLTVVPTSLPPEGGTAQVTATVSNAGKCFVQVNSYAGNFSKSATVSAGTCNQTINVPANDMPAANRMGYYVPGWSHQKPIRAAQGENHVQTRF